MTNKKYIYTFSALILAAGLFEACGEDSKKSENDKIVEDTAEFCNDQIDNDNNGKIDCQENSCKSFDNCQPPAIPVPENTEPLCKDGIDNDNNGKRDCLEDSCKDFEYCLTSSDGKPETTEALCSDGEDNDENGLKDCREESCKAFDVCKDQNGNYMKDSEEPGYESAKECIKHSECSSKFCDSFIGKCSVKCTNTNQCISGFICRPDGRCAAEAFETVWRIEDPDTKIFFSDPEDTVGECDFVIDWGDGSSTEKWTSCPTPEKTLHHVYAKKGEYHVRLTGKMTHWIMADYHNVKSTDKLIGVISFGPVGIAARAFSPKNPTVHDNTVLKNLNTLSTAIDIPDATLLGMNDKHERTLEYMFFGCPIDRGVSKWDISGITSLSGTFVSAVNFNEDLNRWDTSSVTDMSGTFASAWGNSFNGDISKWDTSNVTNMLNMFGQSRFNNDISGWNTSNVTNMERMFQGSAFNGDISKWDTSKVTNMSSMFEDNFVFSGDISNWKTQNVTNMWRMFYHCHEFNHDLSKWNVEKVEEFTGMFGSMNKFNHPPKSWHVKQSATINKMFEKTSMITCDDVVDMINNWGRTESPSDLKPECQ